MPLLIGPVTGAETAAAATPRQSNFSCWPVMTLISWPIAFFTAAVATCPQVPLPIDPIAPPTPAVNTELMNDSALNPCCMPIILATACPARLPAAAPATAASVAVEVPVNTPLSTTACADTYVSPSAMAVAVNASASSRRYHCSVKMQTMITTTITTIIPMVPQPSSCGGGGGLGSVGVVSPSASPAS